MVVEVEVAANDRGSGGFGGHMEGNRGRSAGREDGVAAVFRNHIVLPAGKILETACYRAAFEREFAHARIDGRSGGGDPGKPAGRGGALTRGTEADGGGGPGC